MELGEKIKQARLAAGLSQRQLCGEEITRNMLSLIENGAAKPSMKTLQLIAQRLGKPLSWFLDEDAPAHSALVEAHGKLRRAEEAIADGRHLLAEEILAQTEPPTPGLLREKLLLSARLPGAEAAALCAKLPSLDEELLLRAEAALALGDFPRCGHLLGAAEDQSCVRWNLLAGRLHLALQEYAPAAECFHRVEAREPKTAFPYLEQCYRELGDYRRAYEYACRQK